jgi:hypothetical protein
MRKRSEEKAAGEKFEMHPSVTNLPAPVTTIT